MFVSVIKKTLLHGTAYSWTTKALYVTVKSLCVALYFQFWGRGSNSNLRLPRPDYELDCVTKPSDEEW